MIRPWKILTVVIVLLALGGWVVGQSRDAAPIREGTAAGFWRHACGLNLDQSPERGCWVAFYPRREGSYIYYDQHIHGQVVYRVEESQVREVFPQVRASLDAASEPPNDAWQRKALEAWKQSDPNKTNPDRLLGAIETAFSDARSQQQPDWPVCHEQSIARFATRWARAKRYWLTVSFEFAIRACLIIVAAAPWLRKGGRWAWSMHLGLLPILLLLPWFLGYVPLAFTSLCPAGGIVYPYLVAPFRDLPSASVDRFILSHLPTPLEPLTQSEGPWMSASGTGGPGPLAVLGLGVVIGMACFAIATLLHGYRSQIAIGKGG
jgi:hypothetical protein